MAALAIDLVAFYTARSEAQLAADGAALAGARVLANSGFTSGSVDQGATEDRARAIANQVATSNKVGGRTLVQATEVTVTFNDADPTFATNPHVTVKVQRTDLPTFFAHIWGRATVSVGASATAEAYNPSGADAFGKAPVAPTCVKPWLLPNIDPTNSPNPIFVTDTGVINNPALLGYSTTSHPPTERLRPRCIDCSVAPLPTPVAWQYYPGNPVDFPPPTLALPNCSTTPYENSIAGCVQTTIACGSAINTKHVVTIDTSDYSTRDTETANAVNCLTHAVANNNDADQVDLTVVPSPPFEFLAGNNNPVVGTIGQDVMVSSSLVTVPVFDVGPPPAFAAPPGTVQIVGFVQLFLNPDGQATPNNGGNNGRVQTTVINMAGCGVGWTATPILGNGTSPVTVRLISPP